MNEIDQTEMVIKEGIHGTWFYHLAKPDEYKAVCGAMVMNTEIPLERWGVSGHLNERWCKKCKEGSGWQNHR